MLVPPNILRSEEKEPVLCYITTCSYTHLKGGDYMNLPVFTPKELDVIYKALLKYKPHALAFALR
jgi:hypothetical protein